MTSKQYGDSPIYKIYEYTKNAKNTSKQNTRFATISHCAHAQEYSFIKLTGRRVIVCGEIRT